MVKCCATSCGIAATLIAGMAYCTYMGNRTKLVQDYVQTLTEDQQQIYAKIVAERRGIYLRGFGWGLLLSALLLGIHHQYLTMSRTVLLCNVAAITLATNYFYYMLSPKSDWMVLHFKNKSDSANHSTNNHSTNNHSTNNHSTNNHSTNNHSDAANWLRVYRGMQVNYHVGLVLGIAGTVLLSNAFY
jgi:hypothetical protein